MLSVLGCIDDFLGSVFGSVRSSVNCTPSTMSPRPQCAFSRETKNAPPRTPQLLLGKYFHVREKKNLSLLFLLSFFVAHELEAINSDRIQNWSTSSTA